MLTKKALLVVPFLLSATPVLAQSKDAKLACPAGTKYTEVKAPGDHHAYCLKLGTGGNFGEPVIDGPYVSFHPNGQKKAEGQYVQGFSEGRWTYYDATGKRTGETQFRRGAYDGTRVEYHANGQKKFEQAWEQGYRNGPSVAFDEKGQKQSEAQFDKGVLKAETKFKDGKPVQAQK